MYYLSSADLKLLNKMESYAINSKFIKINFLSNDFWEVKNKSQKVSILRKQKLNNREIKGQFSVLNSKEVNVVEGVMNVKGNLILNYPSKIGQRVDYYLLFYKAEKAVNIRAQMDLQINENFLNKQSEAGVILWTSDVTIDLMIQANSQTIFQLINITKEGLNECLHKHNTPLIETIIGFNQLNIPCFYLSKLTRSINYYLSESIDVILKQQTISFSIFTEYINDILKYPNENFTLLDYFLVMSIEKKIRSSPAITNLNPDNLGYYGGYTPKILAKLFNKIFQKTILEYHKDLHLKWDVTPNNTIFGIKKSGIGQYKKLKSV